MAEGRNTARSPKTLDMIDTFDRKADSETIDLYARTGNYTGKRIPKVGVFAEAGVGKATAEYSIFEADAKGPNASAGAEAGLTGVSAMAKAGLGSASAHAGPIGIEVGLSLDTGVGIGVDGVEAKILGTGFKVGPKTSVSVLGNGVECSVM